MIVRHSSLKHTEVKADEAPNASAAPSICDLFGCLTPVVERITDFINGILVQPRQVSEVGYDHMQRKLIKAIKEHHCDYGHLNVMDSKPYNPLYFSSEGYADIGKRTFMEDAYFLTETPNYLLAGIFDGHHDQGRVANEAKQQFENNFAQDLQNADGDIQKAFQNRVDEIHQHVVRENITGGTTALVCYIDKQTNRIYTATLGDSEAKIFRNGPCGRVCTPLSYVRTWTSKRDADRASDAYEKAGKPSLAILAKTWPRGFNAKEIYFPVDINGTNVSRAIGDIDMVVRDTNDKPYHAISQKVKVTVCDLQEGDTILLSSDGVWDHVKDGEIIDFIDAADERAKSLAEAISLHALGRHEVFKRDNVSTIVIQAAKRVG